MRQVCCEDRSLARQFGSTSDRVSVHLRPHGIQLRSLAHAARRGSAIGRKRRGLTLWPGAAGCGSHRPGPGSEVQQLLSHVGRGRATCSINLVLHACRGVMNFESRVCKRLHRCGSPVLSHDCGRQPMPSEMEGCDNSRQVLDDATSCCRDPAAHIFLFLFVDAARPEWARQSLRQVKVAGVAAHAQRDQRFAIRLRQIVPADKGRAAVSQLLSSCTSD